MPVLREHRSLLVAMCAAQFFMPFMMAGVNAVLPPLGESLGASARELSLVGAVYSLGLVIFQLAGGTLGDIFGRRRVFLAGMGIFGCTSIVLGFVSNMTLFIVLRLVQGTGCALLSSCSLALLVSAAPSELRASYLGISSAAVYAGIACGPPLAGCVAGWLGWQWLFWLTGLAALAAMLLTVFHVRMEWRPARGEHFDTSGCLIYACCMAALTIGASELADYPGLGGAMLALWAVLAVVLCLRELRTAFPLLDVRMLAHNRVTSLSLIAAFINYCSFFGMLFFFSLYLQMGRGMSVQQTGLVLAMQALVQALSSPLAARLCGRWQAGHVCTLGTVLCGCGLLLAAFLELDSTLWLIFGSQGRLGVGVSFFALSNTAIIMESAGEKNVGRASGLVGMVRTAGMLCNMVIITLTLSFFLGHAAVGPDNMPQFLRAMRTDMIFFGVLNLLAVTCTLARNGSRRDGGPREDIA